MLPETRYARSGDVNIAYQVTGNRRFDVVHAPGFVSHVELGWNVNAIASFIRQLSSFCRLIRFDKRGTGMSDRVAGIATLETRMDDVRAVMDAVGSERAALVGTSEGGPLSILFAATYPERAWALVLCGTFPRVRWAPDYPFGESDDDAKQEDAEIEQRWGTVEHAAATAEAIAPSATSEDKLALATMLRQSASPGAALALGRMNREIDVRGVLSSIRVPTLVLNREGEHPFTRKASAYLAQHIPGARHKELPGSDHAIAVGDSESYVRAIEEFLEEVWSEEASAEPEPDRVLATILFTDIVGSTAKAAELGDAGWRELLENHHALVRRLLLRYRGTELDTAGDGFFASFDGPARAIRCARAVTEGVQDLGIEVRAGLHTGECERMNGKVGGIAVHIGARVAAEAGPGEVVVSSTVKDLVAGSGIGFRDRGAAELKGVPGEWRLFAVEIS
ncbi:MAG: adenylate/guanylate cyclase domain-containing protein [Actinomycetota bacterium]|nr:adenylate/guanylate cyclase domain-containing protein [Actinomycetota bacterium]